MNHTNTFPQYRLRRMLTMLAACLMLTACLDEDPKGQLTEEQAFSSASSLYANAVASLYNHIGGKADSEGLQGTYRGVYDFNTFTTDEAMIPTRGGDWYDGGFWQRLYLHTWTASDESLNRTWDYLFKVVMLCNQSLSLIGKYASLLTPAEKQAYTAEVRAIRAMYYFYLLDMFGRVPIVTDANVSVSQVKQSKRSEVFRFVVNELQEVLPSLQFYYSNHLGAYYGRLTQPVGCFLLAKLMLNAEVYSHDDWTTQPRPDGKNIMFAVDGEQMNAWDACLAYCEKLQAMGYELEDDYGDNFDTHNENSQENIFTIPMDKFLYTNVFKNLFRSRHYQHGSAIGMDAENGSCATLSTCRKYGYGSERYDLRFDINFYYDNLTIDDKPVMLEDGTQLNYQPLEVKLDLTGSPYEKTAGARMKKYTLDRTAYSDGQLQANDIVLFRYADIVLMQAEAKCRKGESGQHELDLVRNRVYEEPIECNLQNILDERLRELMWEGWRRQDLIRFDQFHLAYDQRPQLPDEANRYTTVFPIPNDARALNTNLMQNPGYN